MAQPIAGSVLLAQAQTQTISCPEGFDVAIAPLPPLPLRSLKTVANPVLPNGAAGAVRADLAQFVLNQTAAIQLGKALFWEMQAGSDGKTACATCHFQGGADARTRNQLHPGTDGLWNDAGPNAADLPLVPSHFPLSTPATDVSDNNVGSQGVRSAIFGGVDNAGNETTTLAPEPTFGNARRVTGVNAPPTVNAVFNHRNFFDSRAQAEFNGVNPFGPRDPGASVWFLNALGQPAKRFVNLNLASLASQAVGPPTNSVEMSAAGRSFPDLGRKLLKLKPLRLQTVDARDSVLGKLAETRIKGLKTTYPALIQAAFQPGWWNSTTPVVVNNANYSMMEANFSLFWGISIMLYEATLVSDDSPMDQFLDTRLFDAAGFLKKEGSTTKLTTIAKRLQTDYGYAGGVAGILNGLRLFERPLPPAAGVTGRECIACHLGANTTSASVLNIAGAGAEPETQVLKRNGFDLRMERMFMQVPPLPTDVISMAQPTPQAPTFFTGAFTFDPATYAVVATERVDGATLARTVDATPAPVASYDAGWYNIGVRPSSDGLGVGGTDLNGLPLSWIDYIKATVADPSTIKIPGGTVGCINPQYVPGPTPPVLTDALGTPLFPNQALNASGFPLLAGGIKRDEASDSAGSVKTSSLRNVELTGPYFHTGGKSTLKQVVEFYDDGGDSPKVGTPERAAAAFPADPRSPLVKFYDALTSHGLGMTPTELDDLVAFLVALTDDRVRFERAPFDHPELVVPAGGTDADLSTSLPAVGAAGRATPLQPFLGLNPFNQ